MEHEERGQMPTETQIDSEMAQHDAVMQVVRDAEETEVEQAQEVVSTGKRLIGNFNPNGDAQVLKVKEMCAELIDMMIEHQKTKGAINMLLDNAVCEVISAQMKVVKILTYTE